MKTANPLPPGCRPYRLSDWDDICRVHDRARPIELQGSCDPRAFVPLAEDVKERENIEGSRKWVAEMDGAVVAFVGVNRGCMTWLYVDPAYGRQGLGRRLLRVGIEAGANHTYVLAGNEGALALYQNEGFEEVERFRGSNEGYPCLCLKLALRAPTA